MVFIYQMLSQICSCTICFLSGCWCTFRSSAGARGAENGCPGEATLQNIYERVSAVPAVTPSFGLLLGLCFVSVLYGVRRND